MKLAKDNVVDGLSRARYLPSFRSQNAAFLFWEGVGAGLFGLGTYAMLQRGVSGAWWVFAVPVLAAVFCAFQTRAALEREVAQFARDMRRAWEGRREDAATGMPWEPTADERLASVKTAIEMLPRKKRAELQPWIREIFDERGLYRKGHRDHGALEKEFPLF